MDLGEQLAERAAAAERRQQGDLDDADLLAPARHEQPSGGLAVDEHDVSAHAGVLLGVAI